jgi:formylglycine-generating enzyme required for sulfatase activity
MTEAPLMKKERQLAGILCLLAAFLCPPVFGVQSQERSEIPGGHPVTNSIGMSFAYVPAGRFLMGSAWEDQDRQYDEHPHPVRLTSGFWMGTTEVTQGQWKTIMGDSRAHFSGDDLPVESVSWADAVSFCEKLSRKEGKSYRLPTEAEWEYACRAGGEDASAAAGSLEEIAWRSERGAKVVRGGSWGSSARSCRCQARSSMPAAYQEKETGFRVVMAP